MDTILLTRDLIMAAKTPRGGFRKRSMAVFGETMVKGWVSRLSGKTVPWSAYCEFYKANKGVVPDPDVIYAITSQATTQESYVESAEVLGLMRLRMELCGGPCGQSGSALEQREKRRRILTDAIRRLVAYETASAKQATPSFFVRMP